MCVAGAGINLAIGLLGAGVSAYGSYQQSKAQQAALDAQAEQARLNQEQANDLALQQDDKAVQDSYNEKQEAAYQTAESIAVLSASGVEFGEGTVHDLLQGSVEAGYFNEKNALADGLQKSDALRRQGAGYGTQANINSAESESISPFANALTTGFSGASTAASRFLTQRKRPANDYSLGFEGIFG